jgi:hypothetical protein
MLNSEYLRVITQVGDETPTVSRTSAIAARAMRAETVLVVEDDDALRTLFERILILAGYTVLTAANGRRRRIVLSSRGISDGLAAQRARSAWGTIGGRMFSGAIQGRAWGPAAMCGGVA